MSYKIHQQIDIYCKHHRRSSCWLQGAFPALLIRYLMCCCLFFLINQKVFRIILLVLKQLNPQRREITLVLRALQFHVVLGKDGHEGQK